MGEILSWIGFLAYIELNENVALFYLHRVCLEVGACRRASGPTGSKVKPSVVLRTFNDIVHNKPIGEVNIGVGT